MFSFSARCARYAARAPAMAAHRGLAAAASADVAPRASGTSGRYAMALYAAAQKTNSLDAVTADVSAMQELQSATPAFDEFMRNPTLPRMAKVSTLAKVVEKAQFSPTFKNFMMIVAENGRARDAAKIFADFSDMIASTKGEVVLKVTSVEPLSEWELALLKRNIQSRFYSDGSVAEFTVETEIDKSLLGGLTVQIGDRFMDLSTRTELRKLTDVISGSIN